MCQAYNNGYDSTSSVTFSSFQLSLTTGAYDLVKHTMRTRNRKQVESSAIRKVTSPASVAITKPQQIDYAKIVVE